MQDNIAYLSGVLEKWRAFEDVTALHQDILSLDHRAQTFISALPDAKYISSESVMEAYHTTLVANTTDTDTLASPMYISQGVDDWRFWLSSGADLHSNTMPRYHDAIANMDTFRYKHFCISSTSYFCLVPNITEPTNVIVIVKGLSMPIVLRPVGEHYIYLGQCYIHGMMEPKAGELIEEFLIKYDSKENKMVIRRPDGEVRRNGLKMDAGEYLKILGTLGERKIELV